PAHPGPVAGLVRLPPGGSATGVTIIAAHWTQPRAGAGVEASAGGSGGRAQPRRNASATLVRSTKSLVPASSRAECIDRIGMPTSTVRMPNRVAVIGPIVDPHGTVLLETKSWLDTPAASHQPCQAAAPSPSLV